MGEMRNAYNILVAKREEKRQPRRPRLRWKDSIRINLREIGWEGMDRINLNPTIRTSGGLL
jgi:hypothetical protein